MCQKLSNTPEIGSYATVGASKRLLGGRICRAAADSIGVVRCEHKDGRVQVHILHPAEGIIDNEDVHINVLAVWPASGYLLTDRQQA